MTNHAETSPNRYPIYMTAEEMEYLHTVLEAVKNVATRDGRVYSKHGMNASLRTRLENALRR